MFLSGLLRTLEAAPEHQGNGRFSSEPKLALEAFAHIYAGWGLSQDFYRADLHRKALGAPDLDTFLRTDWVERFSLRRAANLYAQALAWFHGDISDNALYAGDLARALQAIRAKVLLLPGETDLYFRVADNAAELKHLAKGELKVIPSIWGHRAGNPSTNAEDVAFLEGCGSRLARGVRSTLLPAKAPASPLIPEKAGRQFSNFQSEPETIWFTPARG